MAQSKLTPPDVDQLAKEVDRLRSMISDMISSISQVADLDNHQSMPGFLMYYRLVMNRLNHLEGQPHEYFSELSEIVFEVKDVSVACLALLNQGNAVGSIDRIANYAEQASDETGSSKLTLIN